MMMSDKRFAKLIEAAELEGSYCGKDAAGRYEVTEDNAARIVAGIDDGDPEVLDTFPTLDISGEWADSPSGDSILFLIGVTDDDIEPEEADELIGAFRDAYDMTVVGDIERRARALSARPSRRERDR